MNCSQCNHPLTIGAKFCPQCGAQVTSPSSHTYVAWDRIAIPLVSVGVAIALMVMAAIPLFEMSNTVSEANNALETFDDGDTNTAIAQQEQAIRDTQDPELKALFLMNLAYMYGTELRDEEALEAFVRARELMTATTSTDYYLVTAEIEYLEGDPQTAEEYYLKAYYEKPADFQINNALNLFYLDLQDEHPEYFRPEQALAHALIASGNSEEEIQNTADENLALAYFFNEEFETTIDIMSSMDIEVFPYLAYWLAWSHYYLGEYDKAREYEAISVANGLETDIVWEEVVE